MTDIVERLNERIIYDAAADGRITDLKLAERLTVERQEAASEITRLRSLVDEAKGTARSCLPVSPQERHTTDGVKLEGWQPIETAPKDGRSILAFNPLVGIYSTAYTTRWTGEPNEEGYEGFPCGFWNMGLGAFPFGQWDCAPTHWQPLPEPPK